MTLTNQPRDTNKMVDTEKGLVDRRIFSDPDIYQMELERIFARAWNFMAHDSQIANPGDFFLTRIGEDRVICVRDLEGNPQVLVNSCRHRGNAVCRAEEGHATSFMCTYHGWTYDLKGALVGVPGFKEVYHEELDRESWGLIKAAKVDSYKGFIFATLDAESPELDEYLGDVGRLCIDILTARGDMQIVEGVEKSSIRCNWKFVADNSADWHHLDVTHASFFMSRAAKGINWSTSTAFEKNLSPPQRVWLGEYGHSYAGLHVAAKIEKKKALSRQTRFDSNDQPGAKETLGAAFSTEGTPYIFPNFSTNYQSALLRLPMGANLTEIWLFVFKDKNLSPERNLNRRRMTIRNSGPAGVVEQDDTENWEQSTQGAMGTVSRRFPMHFGLGLGRGQHVDEEGTPPRIDIHANEYGQRWLYGAWAEWIAADSWADLKANHSPVPLG